MAPHGEGLVSSYNDKMKMNKPPRLSSNELQRTISDISFKIMSKEASTMMMNNHDVHHHHDQNNKNHCSDHEVAVAPAGARASAGVGVANKMLTPISEVEDAKCECCGMSEECTPEYIEKVREKFSGKWICGLCAEAVKEEIEKNGGKKEEAIDSHMHACVRFNKFGRAYPVLFQAEAMREMLKKNAAAAGGGRGLRAKSMSPRDNKSTKIARSSSCIPAITRDMNK